MRVLLGEEAQREFQECGLYRRGRPVAEVEGLIRGTVCRPVPELVEQGYKGFNIVLYKSQYYAMAQTLGPVDVTRTAEATLSEHLTTRRCFTGRSPAEAKRRVDAASERAQPEAGSRDAGETVGDLGISVDGSTGPAGRAEHPRAPENPLVSRDLAEGHQALQRQGWLEACQACIRLLQRNRECAEARIGLGHGLLALGDAKEGLAQLREGLRLDPRPAVAQSLASDLVRFGQVAAGEELLDSPRGKVPEAERVPVR